jgi:hypothetical protein
MFAKFHIKKTFPILLGRWIFRMRGHVVGVTNHTGHLSSLLPPWNPLVTNSIALTALGPLRRKRKLGRPSGHPTY